MRGRHWLGVATLAVLVAATGLASKPSPASTLSREPVAPIADRLGSAPSDQRDVADVDALNEATTREMWGLPPTRDGSPATFHAESGLELSQDEQAHVDHRIAALEVAGAADSEARSLFPDSYAGSYYERGTGTLVVQVVESQAVDASTHLRKTFDPSLVRVNPVRYSLTELSAMEQVAREVIDSRWAGVDRLLGVDNEANRVLIAISEPDIVTRALQAVLPSDGVEVTSLTDAEEQGVGKSGEQINNIPWHPNTFGAQHCTLGASAHTFYGGAWFYYWLTAGHCKDGNAQAPNARRYEHEGVTNIALWQWFRGGSVDIAKVWVDSAQTSNRLTESSAGAGVYADALIKGNNPSASNIQWAPVCFTGYGMNAPSRYRCGHAFCTQCDSVFESVLLTNQYWWLPSSCAFTYDGDSGGPLWYGPPNGVRLVSIHRGGAYIGGTCTGAGTWVAAGSRLDYGLPATGLTLLTG